MSDDLKLSLDSVKREKKDRTALIIALLVILIALAAPNIAQFFRSIGGSGGDPVVLERVALKLEKQELYSAAAETWIEYIEAAAPEKDERARILYRIGRMREQSGDYESALAAYYRSEQTAVISGTRAGDIDGGRAMPDEAGEVLGSALGDRSPDIDRC